MQALSVSTSIGFVLDCHANVSNGLVIVGVVLPTSTDEEEDLYLGNINGSVSGKGALAKFYFSGAEYIFRWTEQYEVRMRPSVAFASCFSAVFRLANR